MSEVIRIFTMGGTIDKVYFDAKSEYEVGKPNIIHALDDIPLSVAYKVTPLMEKDSLEMTDEDRRVLKEHIEAVSEKRIIVTHGTDTMVDTAKALKGLTGRTIVLTGALQPAAFKDSDALFNIGCAFAAVQSLLAGVYIAMNGRVFHADRVTKDREQGRFVDL